MLRLPGAAARVGLGEVLRFARWLRAGYLTLRFVDERTRFPAFVLAGLRLRIRKSPGARLCIAGRLQVIGFHGQTTPSVVDLQRGSELRIEGNLSIGDDVRILLGPGARVRFGGSRDGFTSGITCKSVVLADGRLEVGADTIVSWDTTLSDTDGHPLGDPSAARPTRIGRHVWIGTGAKVLKGASVGDDSIVAAGAVVLQGNHPARALLAGVPARVVRRDIPPWRR